MFPLGAELFKYKTYLLMFCQSSQGIMCLNGRKINFWSTNKYSNGLHTTVSVAFSVHSSVQSKNWRKNAPIYNLTPDPTEREGWLVVCLSPIVHLWDLGL